MAGDSSAAFCLHCSVLRERTFPRFDASSVRSRDARRLTFFENCIEKNFQVSRERHRKRPPLAALRRTRSPCSQDDTVVLRAYAEGVQFCVSKKIIKGMQVDTLVPQAMKDAPSCEKRRVAAKKR